MGRDGARAMERGMKTGHARHQSTSINEGATGKAERGIGKRMGKGIGRGRKQGRARRSMGGGKWGRVEREEEQRNKKWKRAG